MLKRASVLNITYWSTRDLDIGIDAEGELGASVWMTVDTKTDSRGEGFCNKGGEALEELSAMRRCGRYRIDDDTNSTIIHHFLRDGVNVSFLRLAR